jgi:hypothetical protein
MEDVRIVSLDQAYEDLEKAGTKQRKQSWTKRTASGKIVTAHRRKTLAGRNVRQLISPFTRRDAKHSAGFSFLKPTEGGPDITSLDLKNANALFEKNEIRAKVGFENSPYIGHRAVVVHAATKGDLSRAKRHLKDFGIDLT